MRGCARMPATAWGSEVPGVSMTVWFSRGLPSTAVKTRSAIGTALLPLCTMGPNPNGVGLSPDVRTGAAPFVSDDDVWHAFDWRALCSRDVSPERGWRRVVTLVLAGVLVAGCATAAAAPAGCSGVADPTACTRILFVGNSYTYVNDLPTVFARLAASGGHPVQTGMAAVGGATFADQLGSPDTLTKIATARWKYVVLQEQSQIPSSAASRASEMYPSARLLVRRVLGSGAKPLFFLTWGHKDGWPENGMSTYEGMQMQLDAGYWGIADELHVPVVPVGDAWATMYGANRSADLWQADGSHPTMTGTYLAACVFYAAIFHASPEGLAYGADLSADVVRSIQATAAAEVSADPQGWLLP